MTKSELIARLAERFPQLVAKDADFAVKMILDALTSALVKGDRIEIRGFGSFRAELSAAAGRPQPQVGRQGAGTGEVRAALQGRQGVARKGRLRGRGSLTA
jgi:nucleoid DNA-binding protein